jgi:hypothetical protein
MLRSLRRHHVKIGLEYPDDAWYKQTAAVTSVFATSRGGPWSHEAQIRLVHGDCGADVTTHEAVHAALYFYQHQIQKTIPDIEREEILCHLASEIIGKMVDALYDRGVYERVQ